jgi:tRNA-specific 2-thiouridylase
VGRRPFADFLEGYLPPSPGRFLDIQSGADLGEHRGRDAYTHGQRARLSGHGAPLFVAGKRASDGAVWLAPGARHPALYARTALVGGLFWVAGAPPAALLASSGDGDAAAFACEAKARYAQPPAAVSVALTWQDDDVVAREWAPSAFCTPLSGAAAEAEAGVAASAAAGGAAAARAPTLPPAAGHGRFAALRVRFESPARALTPGQALVLYSGDVCLGGGVIRHPGPSLWEQGAPLPDGCE